MGLFDGLKAKKREKEMLLAQQKEFGRELFENGKKAYEDGEYDKAETLLLEACETCADAVIYLGELYCSGLDDNDEVEAFELYERHESKVWKDKSYAVVLRKLAECYYAGRGTAKNRPLAVKRMKEYRLYEENLNKNEYNAFLSDCYIDLWNDIVKIKKAQDADFSEFCAMREQFEAEMGDALKIIEDKKYNRSFQTDYGWIMADTLRKGFDYMETAAEEGDAIAAYNCARMIALPGFATQYTEPIYKYLKMANDAGYHPAAADMFWRYINMFHQNVRPDVSEMEDTAKRLKKGAGAGDGSCQFALALCYAPNFVGSYGMRYNIGTVCSPLQPNSEKFIHLLEQAHRRNCREASVYWAEYLAFGEVWLESGPDRRSGLLYKNEQSEHDPELAYKILEDALEYLQEKKKAPHHDMQSYRTDVFLAKAEYLKELLGKKRSTANAVTEPASKEIETSRKGY